METKKIKRLKPKKIIDPKWIDQNKKEIKLNLYKTLNYIEYIEHFPEEYFKQLKDNNLQWIMVTKPPHTNIKVPKMSIWLAKLVKSNRVNRYGIPVKFFQIITPLGYLNIRMYECNIIDIKEYLKYITPRNGNKEPDYKIHFLSGINSKEFEDKLFYIQSKGIRKEKAISMLIDIISNQNVFYLIPHIEYQKMFCRKHEFIGEDVVKLDPLLNE